MNTRTTSAALAFVTVACGLGLASAAPDGLTIVNSGSTNVSGYTVRVWSNGRAQSGTRTAELSAQATQTLFSAVRIARRQGASSPASCMKSASFGSATHVLYHGWTSGDLECTGNAALTLAAHQAAAALQLPGMPGSRGIRKPMLPNEYRRPEGSSTQPTASPESGTPPE